MAAVDILNDIKSTLIADSALDTFLQSKYSRSLTVQIGARKKESAGLDKFPLAFLTPGDRRVEPRPGLREKNRSDFVIIIGILQKDISLAVPEILEFEDKVEAALYADITRSGFAVDTVLLESAADFDRTHPRHFRVLQFQVNHETAF